MVCTTSVVVHENVRTPHNWVCVVSKGSSFYFCRKVRWLQFQSKAFEFTTAALCEHVTKFYLYFIPYRPCIFPLASPPTSLLSFLQVAKRFSEQEPAHVRMKPSKTNQYFHTIPISCAILQTTHTTKLSTCTMAYSHLLKECLTTHQQGPLHCSLNNLPHAYLPCSAATKVYK